MQTSTSKKPTFPLPRGYFGHVRLSKKQQEYYRELCESQVQRGLLDEKLHVHEGRTVDLRKWKPVRSQHQFQLFRRRDGGLYANDGKPSMLGVGQVEGTIEDALYGAYDQTDDELRMTAGLVDVDFGDGVVLHNVEQGAPHDPYRYLGVKWILTPFPMPGLMVDRDWVLLESSGIAKDEHGRRYGYHTLFTVDLPKCPEFPGVIRGTMWYTFIYRDTGRGLIDVHSQGYFDCKGELLDPFTIIGSTQMFNGVFRYMKSAEAKKLTILALEQLERKYVAGMLPNQKTPIPADATCSICCANRSSMPFSSRRMRVCGVCDAVVCLSCRIKKNILVGRQRVLSCVSVCQKCIAQAKAMVVHPADEKYVVSRELNTRTQTRRRTNTPVRSHAGSTGRKPSLGTPRSLRSIVNEEASIASSDHSSRHREDDPSLREREEPSTDATVRCHEPSHSHHSYYVRGSSVDYVLPNEPTESTTPPLSQSQLQRSPVHVETRAEQSALFERMIELQASARRAHELTEASHLAMVANNVRPQP